MKLPDSLSHPIASRLCTRDATASLRVAGFTLVEAVISVGVISFAMVAILGMIPVGLSNFQSAQQLTIESSIVQGVTGELQRAAVVNLNSTNMYFDDQGRTTSSDAAIYTMKVDAPKNLDSGNLISPTAAKSVLLAVNSRNRPDSTNYYSVILANDQ